MIPQGTTAGTVLITKYLRDAGCALLTTVRYGIDLLLKSVLLVMRSSSQATASLTNNGENKKASKSSA